MYNMAKVLFVAFIFYMVWFQNVFFPISNAPIILGLGMLFFLFLHELSMGKSLSFLITKPIFIWIIFSFYILFSGYIVATNKPLLINSVMTYIQTLGMMIFIVDVSRREGSNIFFIKTFASLTVIYSLTLIFFGFEYYPGRFILSEGSNPNSDGLTLLYGVFCFLVLLNTKKTLTLTLSYVSILMLLYSIVMTGSRKSFLAAILLVILGIIFVVKDVYKFASTKLKVVMSFFIIVTLIVVFEFIPTFLNSSLYIRLSEGITAGDQDRLEMYDLAIDYFYSNPFLGLGFNQFREFYGTYSHSTYAEIISTTGIFGTILYFIPYLIIIYNLLKIFWKEKQSELAGITLTYLLLMVVMLALGTGVIHFYGITGSIAIALMISFYYTYNSNQNIVKK